MAGKKRHVDRGALKVAQAAAVVEHGVCLGVHHVVVLVLERVVRGAPGKIVVVEGRGRPVIAHREDAVVRACNASAHLRIGVFAPELCGNCHAHEELVPTDDVLALS